MLAQEEEEYKFTAITMEDTTLSDSEVLDAVEPLEQSVFMGKLTHSGITQEQLAQKLGVTNQAVSKWENGTSDPSTSNLIAIAKLYNVPPEEILQQIK